MNHSILREQWLDFMYIYRAIFHEDCNQGGSLPFLQLNT
ncbi:RAxF-45 family protein [Actinomycetes bacterium NPDC127524]